MSERGKARYSLVAAGSNTTIKSTPGTLYGLHVSPANGTTIRVEGSKDLGASIDFNAAGGANTIDLISTFASAVPAFVSYGPGVGFDGLAIAATSSARITVIYE